MTIRYLKIAAVLLVVSSILIYVTYSKTFAIWRYGEAFVQIHYVSSYIVDNVGLEFLHTFGIYQYPEDPVAHITAKGEKSVALRTFASSDVKKVDGTYQRNRDPNRDTSTRPICKWHNTSPDKTHGSYSPSPPDHILIECRFRKHWASGLDNILLFIRITRDTNAENGFFLENLSVRNRFGRNYRSFQSHNDRKDLENAKISMDEFIMPVSSSHDLKISMKFEVIKNLIGSSGDFSYEYDFEGLIPPDSSNLRRD
ncbi:MAG: hypothetical protein AAF423_07880 [Pseudomonadota bacterium]